jgi:hypothetical protein
MIDVMEHLSVNNTRVSVTSFSDDIRSAIGMGETFNKNVIKRTLNMIAQSNVKAQVHLETVYAYVKDNIFNKTISRQGAKKFFLIFTNGKADINDESALERDKAMLEANDVNIVAIGSGGDVSLEGLLKLVTDPFNVFITNKDLPMSNLDVLQSYFVYNKCDLKGE